MLEALRNAFKLPDLRRRIFYTLLILVIFRMASNIPVPGVDRLALKAFFDSATAGGETAGLGQFANLLNLLSGGAVQNFSILAAGVYPYVTAQIVLQLLLPIFPKLEQRIKEEGEEGQRKMNQWTFYLTVPLAALSAFGQAQLFRTASIGTQQILPNFGWGPTTTLPTITLLVTMTAGTMFAVWLGELISEQGIGNGLSLIIFGGIVSRVPASFQSIWETDKILGILVYVVIMVLTILFIVFVQDGERRIKVQYGKRVRGMKVYGGGSTYIPLKINTAGMIPLIFAQSILAFPAVIAQFFLGSTNAGVRTFAEKVVGFFGGESVWYAPLFFLAVFGLTYFYTFVMIEQQNLPEHFFLFLGTLQPRKNVEGLVRAFASVSMGVVDWLFAQLFALIVG